MYDTYILTNLHVKNSEALLTRNKSVFINKFHIAKEKQFPKAKGVYRSESAHNNSPARVIDLVLQILVQ